MTDGSAVILLLRMAVSLTVVLGLIVWAARVLSNRGGGLARRPRTAVPVAVLGRQSLSRHASVSVVQVGEQILVLGVTDAEVSLLGEVDPATLPQPDVEPQPQDGDASATPLTLLRRAVAGTSGGQGAPSFAGLVTNNLALRRLVKRQAATARVMADRLAGPDSRLGGRHRG